MLFSEKTSCEMLKNHNHVFQQNTTVTILNTSNSFPAKTIPGKQVTLMLFSEKTSCEMLKNHNGITAKHNTDYLIYQQWFSDSSSCIVKKLFFSPRLGHKFGVAAYMEVRPICG